MPDVHVGCNGAGRERSGDMGATGKPTTDKAQQRVYGIADRNS
jgi:hypothetical protein